MASAKQQENMLLTEHFTWPPISLIDDIINAVNEVLYRCTDSFETGLSAADPALLGFADRYASENRTPEKDEDGQPLYPEAKLEIEEGVLKLETLMENAVDKNFDKLEIWTLRNVLCLPRGEEELANWVRLGHYENLQIRPKDSALTPESLFTLRRKLVETRALHAALVAEKTRNEAQIARLRALLQPPSTNTKQEPRRSTSSSSGHHPNGTGMATETPPFAFLTYNPSAQAIGIQSLPPSSTAISSSSSSVPATTPLSTHTSFTTSQLPYLRQLLATLRPHLPATALPSNTSSSARESSTGRSSSEAATQRKKYVESQSKRVLERRGVDTRDGVEGAWEGGPRVRVEEVRGLEGLVEGMERSGRMKTKEKKKEEEEEEADQEERRQGNHDENEGEAMDLS